MPKFPDVAVRIANPDGATDGYMIRVITALQDAGHAAAALDFYALARVSPTDEGRVAIAGEWVTVV
jgi:hypothetical protein